MREVEVKSESESESKLVDHHVKSRALGVPSTRVPLQARGFNLHTRLSKGAFHASAWRPFCGTLMTLNGLQSHRPRQSSRFSLHPAPERQRR